jgi:hypothetical protein
MGQTSAKFAPKVEDKNKSKNQDGQNSMETAGIGEAEDARDSAEGNAASASHRSPRSAEEAQPAGARALWFGDWRAQWQAQRRVSLGGDEGNRMSNKLPTIRVLTH